MWSRLGVPWLAAPWAEGQFLLSCQAALPTHFSPSSSNNPSTSSSLGQVKGSWLQVAPGSCTLPCGLPTLPTTVSRDFSNYPHIGALPFPARICYWHSVGMAIPYVGLGSSSQGTASLAHTH